MKTKYLAYAGSTSVMVVNVVKESKKYVTISSPLHPEELSKRKKHSVEHCYADTPEQAREFLVKSAESLVKNARNALRLAEERLEAAKNMTFLKVYDDEA